MVQADNSKGTRRRKDLRRLAFARLAVVEAAKGLVLGDVGVEELERVLWDDAVRDDFVVTDDVGEGERAQTVLSVGLHRVELHFSCWEGAKKTSI